MAAKPIERYVKRQIQEQGGWPRILERIASGETIAAIARTLLRPDQVAISRNMLSMMLHADPERSAQVRVAQIEGASAMVDQGLQLVDGAPCDRDSVNKANLQAQLRLKVAGFIDRAAWGENKAGVNVSVSVNAMHVDALRHRIVEASRPLATRLSVSVADGGEMALLTDGSATDTVQEVASHVRDGDSK